MSELIVATVEGPGLKPLNPSGLFVGLKPHAPSERQREAYLSG